MGKEMVGYVVVSARCTDAGRIMTVKAERYLGQDEDSLKDAYLDYASRCADQYTIFAQIHSFDEFGTTGVMSQMYLAAFDYEGYVPHKRTIDACYTCAIIAATIRQNHAMILCNTKPLSK